MTGGSKGGSRPGAGRPLKSATKRKRVSFALPTHQIEQINALAVEQNVSKSDVVASLLESALGPAELSET